MTRLTEAHLKKLPDEDLRAIALRIVNDATGALDTSIEECGLTNHLDPAPVHDAADWLREALINPDDWYDRGTWWRHHYAIDGFFAAARDIAKSTTGNFHTFPPKLNADAVGVIFKSVHTHGGTPHRPSVWWLHVALVECGDRFIPSHETPVGYVLKVLCDTDDPRLPALAESYMQSGLHVNLRPAINRATRQLARLDELAELNR